MQLGVYTPPDNSRSPATTASNVTNADVPPDHIVCRGVYNFATDAWHQRTDGRLVAAASQNPSPAELKVRFDIEQGPHQFVTHPESDRLITTDTPVVFPDHDMSVDTGHEQRDQQNGPPITTIERDIARRNGIHLVANPDDISDTAKQLYTSRGQTVTPVSDWNGITFKDEFDFDFDFDFDSPVTSAEGPDDTHTTSSPHAQHVHPHELE